jgi:hypothetical protein
MPANCVQAPAAASFVKAARSGSLLLVDRDDNDDATAHTRAPSAVLAGCLDSVFSKSMEG